MNLYNTPLYINAKKEEDGITIEYTDIREICQGGPEVGIFVINGKRIKDKLFGGPYIKNKDCLFVPLYKGPHFVLAMINVTTLNIQVVGKSEDLIFLDKIEDNSVFYYTHINKSSWTIVHL